MKGFANYDNWKTTPDDYFYPVEPDCPECGCVMKAGDSYLYKGKTYYDWSCTNKNCSYKLTSSGLVLC